MPNAAGSILNSAVLFFGIPLLIIIAFVFEERAKTNQCLFICFFLFSFVCFISLISLVDTLLLMNVLAIDYLINVTNVVKFFKWK